MSIQTYDELTSVPVPIAAFLHNHVVQVQFSITDNTRNVKRNVSKSIPLDAQALNTMSVTEEIIGVVSTAYSPSGDLKVILRETGDEKDKKRFVEVWNNNPAMLTCKDVTDVHGIFYADDFFNSLCFSPSENFIIYTAEKKKPIEKNSFEKFSYRQPFGEGLAGKHTPVLFLFDWRATKLVSLEHDAPVFFGQALFGRSSEFKIYATGYETASDERLLGIKSCYNRPTGIWQLSITPAQEIQNDADSWKCNVIKLTASHLSCRSPRVVKSNGKDTLLWISQPTGGAHGATSALHSLEITSDIDPSKTQTIVDTVWEPAKDEFPGLYLSDSGLPRTTHVNWGAGDYIVTSTNWGSRFTIVLISLLDGAVKDLTPPDEKLLSWSTVLGAKGDQFVCVRSSLTSPFELVLVKFDTDGTCSFSTIHKTSISAELRTRLNSLTVKIVPIPNRFPTETIVVQQSSSSTKHNEKIPPCITIPHGGPHGAATVTYTASVCFLALEGYTISLPNYTGSTGYGEKYIQALIGQCGTLDVGDCIESVRHLVKIGVANEGRGKMFLGGGSHGGFLLGHLIGQYPHVFTSAVLRNPVISAGEISTSDIQDWYFSEFGIDYALSSLPLGYTGSSTSLKAVVPPRIMTPEVYSKLYYASPIAHVHKVTASVLLLIGDSDQRVAPTQGIGYYHALKALRTDSPDDIEIMVFPGEGHPLEGVEASKVVWLRTVEWFRREAS
ncbi:alpha beta-hydrolase [Lentinula edodes]|uniref:acylaminoacyl-peptidase n=1 Tax=Lentinula edodes TaxID=5353 RepID=A0A1Q3EHR6_LENED|nr:alpha beta-hydrolase [Lentinula edodes]